RPDHELRGAVVAAGPGGLLTRTGLGIREPVRGADDPFECDGEVGRLGHPGIVWRTGHNARRAAESASAPERASLQCGRASPVFRFDAAAAVIRDIALGYITPSSNSFTNGSHLTE